MRLPRAMSYTYQLMWIDRRKHRNSTEKYMTLQANSVHEALQIASYEHGLGLAWDVLVLEARIVKKESAEE